MVGGVLNVGTHVEPAFPLTGNDLAPSCPKPVEDNGVSSGPEEPTVYRNPDVVFHFYDTEIRAVPGDGHVWFDAKKVSDVMVLAFPVFSVVSGQTYIGFMNVSLDAGVAKRSYHRAVSEADIFKLAEKANTGNARKFAEWVKETVLPEIHFEPPAFKSVHPDDLPYAQVAHDLGLSPLPVAVSPKPVEDNQAVPFLFNEHEVRALIGEDGEPWFVARDVAKVLDVSWSGRTLDSIPEGWKGMMKLITPSLSTRGGGVQAVTVISEPAVYKLAFRSNKPEAEEFTNWVASVVMPAIRKHGAYMTPETLEKAILSPDFVIQLATKLKEEQAQNAKLAAEKARIAEEKAKVEFAKRKIEIEKARVVAVDSHALQMQVEKSRVLGPRHDLWVVSRANVQA